MWKVMPLPFGLGKIQIIEPNLKSIWCISKSFLYWSYNQMFSLLEARNQGLANYRP